MVHKLICWLALFSHISYSKKRNSRFPINWGDLTKEQEQLHQQQQQQQQQQQIQQVDEPMVMEEEDENQDKFIVDAPQDVTESMVMTE